MKYRDINVVLFVVLFVLVFSVWMIGQYNHIDNKYPQKDIIELHSHISGHQVSNIKYNDQLSMIAWILENGHSCSVIRRIV